MKNIFKTISNTEGPSSTKESLILFSKGFLMGSADIIPGVSGGTIALITGIYKNLLDAISSINKEVVQNLLKGKINHALSQVHIKFLFILLAGIGSAILFFSRVIKYLLATYPMYCSSLFLGMILASTIILMKGINDWRRNLPYFFLGLSVAYWVVGFIPVETPNSALVLFFSGVVAISAMILPGLSGAFILLILGKYEYILNLIHNLSTSSLMMLGSFAAGCLVGILSFSRVLQFFLKKYYMPTLACLSGLMLGASKKVWPWKEVLETVKIGKKTINFIEVNYIPTEFSYETIIGIGLITIGFFIVYIMDITSSN